MNKPQPTISVSALIIGREHQVLLAQRSQSKSLAPGKWETIGGQLEFGEEPETALRRELREELACEAESWQLFNVYSYVTEAEQLISIVYLVKLKGNPQPNPMEIQQVSWVDRNEAQGLDFAANCQQRVTDYFNSCR